MPDRTPETLAAYRDQTKSRHKLWNRIRYRWAVVVAAVGGIAGFIRFLIGVIATTSQAALYETYFLVVASAAMLLASAALFWVSLRQRRYAYAFEFIHGALHILRDEAVRQSAKYDPKDEHQAVVEVLTAVRSAFCVVSRADCRVTLKTLSDKPDEHAPDSVQTLDAMESGGFVVTYARDLLTHRLIGHLADPAVPLQDNPRFDRFLSSHAERCVVVRDTTKAEDPFTANSSYVKYQGELPYRSQIVWPLRSSVTANGSDYNLFGFLVVDCGRINAFNKKEHFDLGATFADALYLYFASLSRAEKAENARDGSQVTDTPNESFNADKQGGK